MGFGLKEGTVGWGGFGVKREEWGGESWRIWGEFGTVGWGGFGVRREQ